MTNSNKNTDATSILDDVLQHLDEAYLQQKIDIPIKMILAEFDSNEGIEITFQSFLNAIGTFIKRAYQLKIFCNQNLSDEQSQSEAVALLDRLYENTNNDGLMSAYLDTLNAELSGYDFILTQLANILIRVAREKHIKWICSSKLDSLDWPTKYKIERIILSQNHRYLPAEIINCPPGILASQLPHLIQGVATSKLTVNEFPASHIDTFNDQQSEEIETSNHILLLSLLKGFF
jgi:hypothetical protein